jgi:hypothetical protein
LTGYSAAVVCTKAVVTVGTIVHTIFGGVAVKRVRLIFRKSGKCYYMTTEELYDYRKEGVDFDGEKMGS